MWRFNLLLLRLLGEISLSLLCSHSSWGSALDLALPLRVGRLRASVFPFRQDGVKGAADSGVLAHSGLGGREGYRMQGNPTAVEAGVMLQQPEARRVFSQGNCPWITGPWKWWAAQIPRAGVRIVTCACTQGSWWLQQQP